MDNGKDRPEKEKLRANSELMLQTKMLGCMCVPFGQSKNGFLIVKKHFVFQLVICEDCQRCKPFLGFRVPFDREIC